MAELCLSLLSIPSQLAEAYANYGNYAHSPNRPGKITEYLLYPINVDRKVEHHAQRVEEGPDDEHVTREAEQ